MRLGTSTIKTPKTSLTILISGVEIFFFWCFSLFLVKYGLIE